MANNDGRQRRDRGKDSPGELATCPRCLGTGRGVWKKPDGTTEAVRCGLCRGSGRHTVLKRKPKAQTQTLPEGETDDDEHRD